MTTLEQLEQLATRYRARAKEFARKVTAASPENWDNQSPCEKWLARDVVGHVIDMHAVMLRPLGRALSPAPSVADDPAAAFTAAHTDIDTLLDDPETAGTLVETPSGEMTVAQHIAGVLSPDIVLHGWDLARATGQDETMDPSDVEALWLVYSAIDTQTLDLLRTPGAFGEGIEVFGPEVKVPEDAPTQDRLLGMIGRDPHRS